MARQVSAMLHLLQMSPSKVLTTSPLQIQSSWQLSLLELLPCQITVTCITVPPCRHVYLHCAIWLRLCQRCSLAPPSSPNLLSPICPLYISFLCPPPPSFSPGFTSAPPVSTPLTLSGFFNGMLEVFDPGALNYSTFFRPILSTLSAFRNPILTYLPLYRFLDSPLCVLIVLTPGLAFAFQIPRTLVVALSFWSHTAYPFLNFLPPLFLRSIPGLIM